MLGTAGRAGILALVAVFRADGWCVPKWPAACMGNAWGLVERSAPFHGLKVGSFAHPQAVDFDGDGDLDLVVGHSDGSVRYFERLPDGSLVERRGRGRSPFHGISVGAFALPQTLDFDADGDLDLIVGEGGASGYAAIHYYERLPNRSFAERIGLGLNPFHDVTMEGEFGEFASPQAVDFDGDGDLDLIVSDANGWVYYFERLPDGSLQRRYDDSNPFQWVAVRTNLEPTNYASAQAVDIDGDGDLDLIVGARGRVRSYEQLSDGTFREFEGRANPFYSVGVNQYAIPQALDFDGDGDLDLVVGDGLGYVHFFERLPNATFVERTDRGSSPVQSLADYKQEHSVPSAVDFDGDGHLDLFIGDSHGAVTLFAGPDLLSGYSGIQMQVAGGGAYPQAVDFDGDGDFDLVVGSKLGRLHYFENNLPIEWIDRSSPGVNPFHGIEVLSSDSPGHGLAAPQVLDFDGDGDLDLVLGDGDGRIHYFERLPNGSFAERIGPGNNPFDGIDVGGTAAPQVLDFDRDGDLDLVVGAYDGTISYFERLVDATFAERQGQGSSPFYGIDVGLHSTPHAVDWDGDGDLDLISGDGGRAVHYFERGGCSVPIECSLKGMCDRITSKCHCLSGYSSADCSACDEGYEPGVRTYGEADPLRCIPCGRGRSSLAGNSTCAACGPNAVARVASAICSHCESGKAPSASKDSCEACPLGKFAGNATCQTCPDGFIPAHDRGSCRPCPAGSHVRGGGSTCMLCPAGSSSGPASGECAACGSGRHAVHGSACMPCAGNAVPSANRTSCTPCGSFRSPSDDGETCDVRNSMRILEVAAPAAVGVLAVALCLWRRSRQQAKAAIRAAVKKKDAGSLRGAIERGVRLRIGKDALSDAQHALQMYDNKYVDLGFLLRIVGEGDLKLLKGSWLAAQAEPFRLERQQDLPPAAFWSADELQSQQRLVLFVAVSYCWLHKLHPDPRGEHLRTLAHAVRLRLQLRGLGSVEDIALFLDYCSLPQHGMKVGPSELEEGAERTPEEQESFRRGLRQVNVLYANQLVEVWMMKWVPEEEPRTYMARGWPYFEQAVAGLIKDSTRLIEVSPSILLNDNWQDVFESNLGSRKPPLTPEEFEDAIQARTFTSGSDRGFVVNKYRETFDEVVGNASTLWFSGLGWTDDDALGLARMLPAARSLRQVFLGSNKLTAEGALALAAAAEDCPKLRGIDLSCNSISAGDREAIRRRWGEAGKEDSHLRMGSLHGSFDDLPVAPRSSSMIFDDLPPV